MCFTLLFEKYANIRNCVYYTYDFRFLLTTITRYSPEYVNYSSSSLKRIFVCVLKKKYNK